MGASLNMTSVDHAWPKADVQPAQPTHRTVGVLAPSARDSANRAMDRYADGEDAAFEEVYDFLAPRLYAFFVRHTGEAAAAEDLLQQTLLKLHLARGDFVKQTGILPWAFAIGRRLFIDGYRRRKREALHREAEPLDVAATVEGADDLLEAKRAVVELDRQLALLPEAQRVVFELMKRDGLTMREVAQVLGTTTNAVKLRAHRAHAALRIAMKDMSDDL
jgi:RNA polymerase sigma-70 factor (ECF subfamily)